jgi:hypothetical protein
MILYGRGELRRYGLSLGFNHKISSHQVTSRDLRALLLIFDFLVFLVHFEVNYELYKLRTVAQSTEERYMDRQRREDSDALHLTFWSVLLFIFLLEKASCPLVLSVMRA